MTKSVFFYNLGCYDRSLEEEALKEIFQKEGYKIEERIRKADTLIITTCAHISSTENHSLFVIKRLYKLKKKNAKIIVGGCLPVINPALLKKVHTGHVFSPLNIREFASSFINKEVKLELPNIRHECHAIKRLINSALIYGLRGAFTNSLNYIRNQASKEKDAYYIKISDGCMGNCSFCGIKKIHGAFRSRKLKDIKKEFFNGLQHGYKNFLLLSKDTGAYGLDINSSLIKLLDELLKFKENYKIHFPSSINAHWIMILYLQLIKLLKDNRSKIDEIVISIQSGSARVLKLMNRPPLDFDKLNWIIKEFKKIPTIRISTQFMVGHPGEQEEDLNKTIEFVLESKPSKVEIFKFTERPETAAAELPDKIPEDIVHKRLEKFKIYLKRAKIQFVIYNP